MLVGASMATGRQGGMPVYVILAAAVATVLLGTAGGPLLYGALSARLPAAETIQRSVLFGMVMAPFYVVAGAMLRLEKRPARADRMGPVAGIGGGALFGALGFGTAVGLTSLLGALAFGAPAPPIQALDFAVAILLMTFQVWGEEFFFRGWLQPALDRRLGSVWALGLASVAFGAAHAIGRHLSVLALVNDTLAGVAFGLLARRSGGLWAPFAAHFAWDALEQCVAGLTPNPGIDPLGSLFNLELAGPDWIAGGADELNGSIACTLALGMMILAAVYWRRPAPREMPAAA
jgi:membrane protease YdiL (CAAX protease family)